MSIALRRVTVKTKLSAMVSNDYTFSNEIMFAPVFYPAPQAVLYQRH